MLGVATFAVGSMVAAFASAASGATPRVFKLIVSDDASQYALSVFIAAYIFSIIGLIAVETDQMGRIGRLSMFLTILAYFAWVVLTFVRWVDKIARLGRMGDSTTRLEKATLDP